MYKCDSAKGKFYINKINGLVVWVRKSYLKCLGYFCAFPFSGTVKLNFGLVYGHCQTQVWMIDCQTQVWIPSLLR
jgi:hypothetical protein